MPTGKNLTDELHAEIIRLHEEGWSYSAAARTLGVPVGTYAGWLYKCRHIHGVRIERNETVDQTGRRLVTTIPTLPYLKFMDGWNGNVDDWLELRGCDAAQTRQG